MARFKKFSVSAACILLMIVLIQNPDLFYSQIRHGNFTSYNMPPFEKSVHSPCVWTPHGAFQPPLFYRHPTWQRRPAPCFNELLRKYFLMKRHLCLNDAVQVKTSFASGQTVTLMLTALWL